MTQASDPNPTAPPRRRRWYLRWWAILFFHIPVGFVLAIVLSWFIWLWVATYQRNAAISQLRAAGIPTSFEEHLRSLSPLPDAANPAVDYLAAIALVDASGPIFVEFKEWQIPETAMTPEERVQWLALQADLVEEHPEPIERIALADSKIRPAVDVVQADFGVWRSLKADIEAGNKPRNPIDIALPNLNDVRTLAKLLAADARTAANEGDGERAVRQVGRLIGLADAVAADANTLVEHLVSTGMRALAASAAIDVSLSTSDAKVPDELEAGVIALLLDNETQREQYARSIRSEAAFQFETLQALDEGRVSIAALDGGAESQSWIDFLTRPILRGDAAQVAEYMQRWYATAEAPDWPTAADVLPPVHEMSVLDLYASILLPSLDRATEAQFRGRTDCALSAAALAIARYRRDHAGEWPESLQVLVPNYLREVPRDAMARGGLIRYDAQRRLLWSVGADGVDDGGDAISTRRNGEKASRWDGKDVVVELE